MQDLVNPLDKEQVSHQEHLMNIFKGQVADETCNLQDALEIGKEQSSAFKKNLPNRFYNTTSQEVKPMVPKNRKKAVLQTKDIDTNLIYSRALVLTQNDPDNSDLNIRKILNHELFSSPLSLFNADSEMRISKSKSSLMTVL